MTTTANKLTETLRDCANTLPNLATKPERDRLLSVVLTALADYDRNVQVRRETLTIAAAMLDHPEVRAIPFAIPSTNIARALRVLAK